MISEKDLEEMRRADAEIDADGYIEDNWYDGEDGISVKAQMIRDLKRELDAIGDYRHRRGELSYMTEEQRHARTLERKRIREKIRRLTDDEYRLKKNAQALAFYHKKREAWVKYKSGETSVKAKPVYDPVKRREDYLKNRQRYLDANKRSHAKWTPERKKEYAAKARERYYANHEENKRKHREYYRERSRKEREKIAEMGNRQATD